MEAFVDRVLTTEGGLAELYDIKGELSGAQSGAIEVISRQNGVHYAMRKIANDDLKKSKRKRGEVCDSIEAQRKLADAAADDEELSGASLPRLHEVVQSPKSLHLISELVPRGGDDLLSMIERRGRLKEPDARQIFSKLVLATKKAHDAGVVLRNIKPEAVQVQKNPADGSLDVWVADLRCAILVADVGDEDDVLIGLHGTPEYSAPEEVIWYWAMLEPPQMDEPPPPYGRKVDLWALGMCLHVMLAGCFPFDSSLDDEAMLREVCLAAFSFGDPGWAKLSADALDLVQQLLQRDPNERPYLEEVLQHPFCASTVSDAINVARANSAKLADRDLDAALEALDMGDDDDE